MADTEDITDGDMDSSAIEIVALEPFLEWVNQLENDDEKISLEELEDDSNIYLIPECETEEDILNILSMKHEVIFANELYDWSTNEDEWPENRDFETFKKWFGVRFHSIVFDLTQ
ncbi:MAG: hypothetical protein HQL32_06995 [Planctomycetes bacterium]|nr:hypothetical protein [Planctomycetota bacterium]